MSPKKYAGRAAETPARRPIAGLLKDLKQRGLLKDTLVIWGGEFGRMPIAQMENGMETVAAGVPVGDLAELGGELRKLLRRRLVAVELLVRRHRLHLLLRH